MTYPHARGDRTPVPYAPYVEPDHGPGCSCLDCCSCDVFDPHDGVTTSE